MRKHHYLLLIEVYIDYNEGCQSNKKLTENKITKAEMDRKNRIIMRTIYLQFLVVASIFIFLLIGLGCNDENKAFKAAEKENTVSSYELFLKNYANGKNSSRVKEKLGKLLLSNLDPDWVVILAGEFIDDECRIIKVNDNSIPLEKRLLSGTWYGHQYIRNVDSGMIDWKIPHPSEQKIVLLIFKSDGLPEELKINNAYLWRGSKDFTFIKSININLETEELLKQFGMKNHGFGLNKPISFLFNK